MYVKDAIILAVVQGLTESLPVSSKTHLLFTRRFLELPVGSLPAIHLPDRRRWIGLLKERRAEIPRLVLSTIPLVAAGRPLQQLEGV
jgi:undecaprenyl pyrophosphate phosphatase UppP